MNRIKSVVLAGALILTVGANTGCGADKEEKVEIKVWETEHECGTWEVDSFDELILDNRLPLEEIAKEIPDFCYFKERPEGFQGERDWDYMASVPVSIEGSSYDFQIYLYFNADKEFTGWGNTFIRTMDDESGDEFIAEWSGVIGASLGESDSDHLSDNSFGRQWDIGDSFVNLGAEEAEELAMEIAGSVVSFHIRYSIEYYPR